LIYRMDTSIPLRLFLFDSYSCEGTTPSFFSPPKRTLFLLSTCRGSVQLNFLAIIRYPVVPPWLDPPVFLAFDEATRSQISPLPSMLSLLMLSSLLHFPRSTQRRPGSRFSTSVMVIRPRFSLSRFTLTLVSFLPFSLTFSVHEPAQFLPLSRWDYSRSSPFFCRAAVSSWPRSSSLFYVEEPFLIFFIAFSSWSPPSSFPPPIFDTSIFS